MSRLGIVFLMWKRRLQKRLVGRGVSLKQLYLLRRLARRGSMMPSEVADKLFCDRPTASVIIRNMERKGWIVKERDPKNARQVLISLSPAGRAKAEELGGALSGAGDPLACLSPEERQAFEAALLKVQVYISSL
jgi:DNA-binding MarR family transcriptional regulator